MKSTRGYGKARKPKQFAEGGEVTLAERLRKLVGMPTKQRGKQLDEQEQEILNPKVKVKVKEK